MKKILPFLLALCTFFSLLPYSALAAEYQYEAPVEPELWTEPDFSADHAYSIAFVGDTQYISRGDALRGTHKMDQLFGIIADTAEERKLEHVFVLGDITDTGYHNDANLAANFIDPPSTAEWDISQKAIFQLNEADVSYSLCRGNHDDYMMDDYFNVPAYTDQFKDCGGFFSDSKAKHPTLRETDNPDGYIYWSAATGYHENSIVNSYKTAEIYGTKYIFITVDYNPTKNVVRWLDEILGKYSDHLAIVTTHSYLTKNGQLCTTEKGNTKFPLGNTANVLWDTALKHHPNVLAVVCGHVSNTKPLYTVRKGTSGNVVREILVNPQGYDTKESDTGAENLKGIQDTGLVLYMNFSADGKKVTFDYYSTLLNKEMADADHPITLYDENPALPKKEESVEVNAKVPKPNENPTVTSSSNELGGESSPLPAILVVSAVVLLGVAVFIVLRIRKKKE